MKDANCSCSIETKADLIPFVEYFTIQLIINFPQKAFVFIHLGLNKSDVKEIFFKANNKRQER